MAPYHGFAYSLTSNYTEIAHFCQSGESRHIKEENKPIVKQEVIAVGVVGFEIFVLKLSAAQRKTLIRESWCQTNCPDIIKT